MITIYDFHPTREELAKVVCPMFADRSKEEYLKYRDQKTCYRDIAVLFWKRGKKRKARRYLKKTYPDMRRTFLLAEKGF